MKAKHIVFTLIAIVIFIGIFSSQQQAQKKGSEEITLTAFKEKMKIAGRDASVVESSDGLVILMDKDEQFYTHVNPLESPIVSYVEESELNYRFIDNEGGLFSSLGGILILIFVGLLVFSFIVSRNQNKTPEKKGKKEQKIVFEKPTVSLKDVGGLNEETKNELKQIIELFKEHDKAKVLGIEKPKSALLHGPPGTGKTLIAKAIAHELNAVFFAKSASSFMEMYVGVGSSRIRELFQMARGVATPEKPSLIFLDEIDAIAKKRGGRNSHEERENTLNELLKELDGVETNENVFFIAATNLYDSLDEAFKRSGRISNELYIGLPEEKGRTEILHIHAKTYKLSEEVKNQIPSIASNVRGYSGADIAEMFAKAAKQAFHKKKESLEMEDIQYAIDRMALGTQSHRLTDVEVQRRVAYHESGHALVQALKFPNTIRKATIIPRGGALGFVAPIPKEIDLATHEELMDKLSMIVAGGVAEREIFGQHSIGVGGDVQQARQLIDAMVEWGILEKDFRLIYRKGEIEEMKQQLFQEAVERSRQYLTTHKKTLHRIAEALLEKETLDGAEIQSLLETP